MATELIDRSTADLQGGIERALDLLPREPYMRALDAKAREYSALMGLQPDGDLMLGAIDLYSQLTEQIDSVAAGEDHPPAGPPAELEEERRMRRHLRFEGRNRGAAQLAKREQGYRCQGCEVDYVELYGDAGKRCVEAHHLIPSAARGEGRRSLTRCVTLQLSARTATASYTVGDPSP